MLPLCTPVASAWGRAAQLQAGLQPGRAHRLLQPTSVARRSGVFRHDGERRSRLSSIAFGGLQC